MFLTNFYPQIEVTGMFISCRNVTEWKINWQACLQPMVQTKHSPDDPLKILLNTELLLNRSSDKI